MRPPAHPSALAWPRRWRCSAQRSPPRFLEFRTIPLADSLTHSGQLQPRTRRLPQQASSGVRNRGRDDETVTLYPSLLSCRRS